MDDPREVDRAALLGTALAAVVALTFAGDGEWDLLATLSGGALLAIIAAFFRLPAGGRRRHVELVAVAAVVGLCSALVLAAPLQAVLSATPAAAPCRAAGAFEGAQVRSAGEAAARLPADVLAAAAEDREREEFGGCLGRTTSRLLWIPVVVVAGSVVALGELPLRRRRR
jgi:hypothetical protein